MRAKCTTTLPASSPSGKASQFDLHKLTQTRLSALLVSDLRDDGCDGLIVRAAATLSLSRYEVRVKSYRNTISKSSNGIVDNIGNQ